MAEPRYVVIANADSKRWETYAPERLSFWEARGVRQLSRSGGATREANRRNRTYKWRLDDFGS